jgi:hypothetical protein
MTMEEFRAPLVGSPFRPFKVVSAEGHEMDVPHPDYVSISPDGRTAVIWKSRGGHNVVDLLLVTRLEFAPSRTN